MAKNKDSKTVNRTGIFDVGTMTIKYEDKNGIQIYDMKALIQSFDGDYLSWTMASEDDPSHVVDQ